MTKAPPGSVFACRPFGHGCKVALGALHFGSGQMRWAAGVVKEVIQDKGHVDRSNEVPVPSGSTTVTMENSVDLLFPHDFLSNFNELDQ